MDENFETVEMEISEEDILYYLEDEDGIEVGFVIEEDGVEVECYYAEFESLEFEILDEPAKSSGSSPSTSKKDAEDPEDDEEPGYLYKMAAIAGHQGGKARKAAEKKLDGVREKAEKQAMKAKDVATEQAKKAKAKADEIDLGFTRENVAEMTDDLNAVAREGIDTAREMKELYDDLMGSFDFLPKNRK